MAKRRGSLAFMIDNFALALSHGLLLLTAWRVLTRPDLDDAAAPAPPPPARPDRRAAAKLRKG